MGRQVGKTIGLRLKMAMGSSTRNTLWWTCESIEGRWSEKEIGGVWGWKEKVGWQEGRLEEQNQGSVECYRVGKQGDASSNQQGGECGWCKGPGCRLAALKAACWLLEQDQKRRQRNCPGFNRNLQGLGEEAEGAQREVIHCEIFLMVNKCLKVWKISTK